MQSIIAFGCGYLVAHTVQACGGIKGTIRVYRDEITAGVDRYRSMTDQAMVDSRLEAIQKFADRHPDVKPSELFSLTGLDSISDIEKQYNRLS